VSVATYTAEVQAAIEALVDEFPGTAATPDGNGGAFVSVPELRIGPSWTPSVIILKLQLTYNYPDAAIYPFYAPQELQRTQGAWPGNMARGASFNGESLIQISLRANRWHPATDTAVGAVHQVGKWLREVP
jgi:hypothetical protein